VFPLRYELNLYMLCKESRPPLWSSGQSSWLQIQVRVRFPALPDILRSSVSGLEIREYGLGIRHVDHVTPSILKSWH
jgi:hypothetical protein